MNDFSVNVSRYLDSFEELFWMYEHSSSFAPVLCIELQGDIPADGWRNNITKLGELYPVMCCSIKKTAGHRPRFVNNESVKIQFNKEVLDASVSIEKHMENELNIGFADTQNGLVRFTLLQRKNNAYLLIAAHHSAYDGRSLTMMAEDLLALASGEEINRDCRRHSSATKLMQGVDPANYSTTLSEQYNVGSTPPLIPSSVIRKTLSRAFTSHLLEVCKSRGISLASAVTTALADAGRAVDTDWAGRELRCVAPIDLRPFYEAYNCSGLLIGVANASIVNKPHEGFWDKANINHDRLKDKLSAEAFINQFDYMRGFFSEERHLDDALTQWRKLSSTCDLVINNYGKKFIRERYDGFRVVSASSASLPANNVTQKISIINIDGCITLTLASLMPMHNLLDDAVDRLMTHCTEALA